MAQYSHGTGADSACLDHIAFGGLTQVEICGGAARVPWVKVGFGAESSLCLPPSSLSRRMHATDETWQEMCSKAFGGKELSTTMNADECVARGHLISACCNFGLCSIVSCLCQSLQDCSMLVYWSAARMCPPSCYPVTAVQSTGLQGGGSPDSR